MFQPDVFHVFFILFWSIVVLNNSQVSADGIGLCEPDLHPGHRGANTPRLQRDLLPVLRSGHHGQNESE